MKPASQELRKAAERLLTFEAGGPLRSVEEGTAAATRIYENLSQNLAPIIGQIGFESLFARALHLSKPALAALREVDSRAPADAVRSALCSCLKSQAPAAIAEIVTTLTATFVGLLSTFIGHGLTWKLLRNAWPEALPNELPSGEDT